MSDAANDGRSESPEDVLVEIDGLKKYFRNEASVLDAVELDFSSPFRPVRLDRSWVRAVDDVSLSIREGEVLGLVGESGCGKSTLGETILHLIEPTDGDVRFRGESLSSLSAEAIRRKREEMQMIFQDPQSSLNPRMKVGKIIEAPMKAHGISNGSERQRRTVDLLERVGLEASHYNRYPHEFSGGQRQRINLARALSVDPDFIVCDEPVSALDVSIQANILNTMKDLQEEFDLTYLFITHDLSVLRYIADRVAVMYLGEIVEVAETDELFEEPRHPYTKSLLNALPVPDPDATGGRTILRGEVPSPTDPPSGCRFRTRCPELIAPESIEVGERTWDALLTFLRAVQLRSLDPNRSAAELEADYFGDATLDGELQGTVREALQAADDGEWKRAETLVTETLEAPSVCARESPAYELSADDSTRYCACHRVREDAPTSADD